jgi:hypothetical protein
MNRTLLFQRLIHLPRRIVREFLMATQIGLFFLINRFGNKPVTKPGGPAVSLTTYGRRSEKVYYAIESIAIGTIRPSRLILWIDDEALLKNLPTTIRRLQKRGLEVKSCRNYGPHTKYYPYLESKEAFDTPLVTADDDVLYPRYWLKKLIEANQEYPNAVNCFWAHVVAMNESGIRKYTDWKQCDTTRPSFRHQADGVMGVIYPTSFLKVLRLAGTAFESCCPKGDDLWLHVQALRSGFKVRQILPRLPYFSFQGIPGTQHTALCFDNVDGVGNDLQINATYNEADVQRLHTD